ncbi:MAG: 50S ribosomal protein L24 [Nitrospirota bacterium]
MSESKAIVPKFRVRKGDIVKITTGKDKGKTGKVLEVDRSKQRVFVEKLNIIKRHMKPSQTHRQGGIIEREASVHVSNVMIVCKSCGKSSRAGIRRMEDGEKLRYCKKCNEIIDRG